MVFVLVIVVIIAIVLLAKVWHSHKVPKTNSLALITGGIKTGKTTFATYLALTQYKRNFRRYRVVNFFCKVFHKPLPEKPLLYSNIPLTVPYVPLTQSLLLRKTRFNYKSIVLISEASLVADSQLIQNNDLNDNLLLFVKLIAHETKGGGVVLDTQSTQDLHYAFRRCLSERFYIHHIFKWCPFFIIAWIMEQRYSDDGTIVTVQNEDVEENLKWILIPKSVWKKFDRYTYSALTDHLPVISDTRKGEPGHLKSTNIISFRDRSCFKAVDLKKKSSSVSSKSFRIVPSVVPVQSDLPSVTPVMPEVKENEKKDN